MTSYNKGDVILIPFPFSDLSGTKKRPVVVLAAVPHRKELVCMMLTSTDKVDAKVDYPIKNTEKAGLLFNPTFARTSKLFTTTELLVNRKLGQLDSRDLKEIINKVFNLIKEN